MTKFINPVDDDVVQLASRLYDVHFDQRGGLLPDSQVFKEYSPRNQGRDGVGDMFNWAKRRIFKPIRERYVPMVTKGARATGREIYSGLRNYFGDIREAGKRRFNETTAALSKKFNDNWPQMAGGHYGGGGRGNKNLHHAVKLYSF